MFYDILTLSFILISYIRHTDQCLFHQKTGTSLEAKAAHDKSPAYERKIYYKDEKSPSCLCGIKEPNCRRWNLFHVYTKLPDGHWYTCMAIPVASNLLITSHHCLIPPDQKWFHHNAWSIGHDVTHTISKEHIRVSSIAFTGLLNFTVKKVITHPEFTKEWFNKTLLSDNDVAIIIIEENIIDQDFNTFSLPPSDIFPTAALYRKADYVGSGGEFPGDNTTETRFVLNSVVMRAEECAMENKFALGPSKHSLCILFRDDAPRTEGGALTLHGRGVDPTPFLVGIASNVGFEIQGTSIKYSVFTNIIPHLKYIEEYAKKYDSKWCEVRETFNPPSQVHVEHRDIKLYPWEAPVRLPPRDESLDCVCGLRTEGYVGKYQNIPPTPAPSPPGQPRTDDFSRISGGSFALEYEFPWMIFLRIKKSGVCGASIINDKMILTAAHCVTEKGPTGQLRTLYPGEIEAYAHVWNFQLDTPNDYYPPPPDPALLLDISHIEVFPDYKLGQAKAYAETDADLALLIMRNSLGAAFPPSLNIKEPALFRPICVPQRELPIDLKDKTAHLSGWGHIKHPALVTPDQPSGTSDFLKKGAYPIKPLEECANFTYGVITPNMICATSYDVEDSALPGDSGSPLSIELADGLFTQIGMTSFGDEFNQKAHPGIHLVFYTNLQKFLRFIDYHAYMNGAKWCDKSNL